MSCNVVVEILLNKNGKIFYLQPWGFVLQKVGEEEGFLESRPHGIFIRKWSFFFSSWKKSKHLNGSKFFSYQPSISLKETVKMICEDFIS